MVRTGDIQGVVIVKLDRGFRSASDCLNCVEDWDRRKVALHIVDLGGTSIDTTSPAGKFMLTVLAAAAEMERGMIRDRCNAGRRARKAEGKRIGEVPFGWTLGEDEKTLLEEPNEQGAIALMTRLYAEGHSLRAIAEELTSRDIPSKKGGAWTHKQISSVLQRVS